MNRESFIYASSRLRTLETKVLQLSKIERLLGAKNLEEAHRMLNEMGYGEHGSLEKESGFQVALNKDLKETQDLIIKICPKTDLEDILFLAYDIHNLRALIKAEFLGKSLTETLEQLIELGEVDMEQWFNYWKDKNPQGLLIPKEKADFLHETYKAAKKILEETRNPQWMDMFLDKKLLEFLLKKAEDLQNEFLQKWIRTQIDMANLAILFRMKRFKKEGDRDKFKKFLVKGGFIAFDKIEKALPKNWKLIPADFQATDYKKLIEKTVEAMAQGKEWEIFNAEKANLMKKVMDETKRVSYGPEVVAHYFWEKQKEAEVIRMIMVGKQNDLSKEEVRKRLYNLYA